MAWRLRFKCLSFGSYGNSLCTCWDSVALECLRTETLQPQTLSHMTPRTSTRESEAFTQNPLLNPHLKALTSPIRPFPNTCQGFQDRPRKPKKLYKTLNPKALSSVVLLRSMSWSRASLKPKMPIDSMYSVRSVPLVVRASKTMLRSRRPKTVVPKAKPLSSLNVPECPNGDCTACRGVATRNRIQGGGLLRDIQDRV